MYSLDDVAVGAGMMDVLLNSLTIAVVALTYSCLREKQAKQGSSVKNHGYFAHKLFNEFNNVA